MKDIAYKGPRIAPGPERSDKEPQLDAVVVIPAFDEGLGVVDTLESVALQRKPKSRELVQGVVVVINNRPNATPEVMASNMQTYITLQGLRHGVKMSVRGNPELTNKLAAIQQSGIRIEVVDAFSEGHAHEESNVGRARKIGTDEALKIVKGPRSAIISTDADTQLGQDTLLAIQGVFEREPIDATPLELGRNIHNLEDNEKKAYGYYSLYWGLNSAAINTPYKTEALRKKGMPFSLRRHALINSSTVWLSGGGTTFTAEAYQKSGGYRSVGTAEDTLLAADMVKGGARVADVTKKYPQLVAYTRPRISMRTARGFGHTIAQWDEADANFGDIKVVHPEASRRGYEFYKGIDRLVHAPRDKRTELGFRKACQSFEIPKETADELWGLFSKWSGTASREEHFDFMRATSHYFDKTLPQIPMTELVRIVETENSQYSRAVAEAHWSGLDMSPDETKWNWTEFQKAMEEMIRDTGLRLADDTLLKVRAVIAAAYITHYQPVVQSWMFMMVGKLRKAIIKAGARNQQQERLSSAKHLDKFTVKEFYRLNLCQMEAAKIVVLRQMGALLDGLLEKETQSKINEKLTKARTDYDEIANAIIDDPHGLDA